MNDLISIDEVFKMLTDIEITGGTLTEAKCCLRDIGKAYDLDKVVEQLEELRNNKGSGCTYQKMYADAKIDRAIEIVKEGGKK